MGWSFGHLTLLLVLADARAQTPCSMASTITVSLNEGNVTATQPLNSTSPYQAPLPVNGTLGGTNGITLVMTSNKPLAPNPNNTFRIEDVGTGTRIRLITSVDRDGPDFTNLDDTEIISFQLKCTINANASRTAYATVNVNIQDVNDNSPQFINMPYSVSVEELTPVGTTIYRQISALDKDSSLQATIDYTILARDGSVMDGTRTFTFNSTRFPNLIISQALDFESIYALGQTTYVMNVVATDLGTPPLSSVAQVIVTVTDSDDMAPAFVYDNCLLSGIYCVNPRYSTSVVSGQVTNPLTIYPLVGFTRQTAITIRAVDRDTLRSPLTFRIAGTSPVGYETYFLVAGSGPVSSGDKDIYTATLTQLHPITRNISLTRVEMYILATQANGKYEERAKVSVEIDIPNSSPPTVTTATGVNTGYIYENSHLGQNVLDGTTSLAKPLWLIVTDPDDSISGQKTTFSFSTSIRLFNVDSNGYIYLASGNLDYETTKNATINVKVTEINTAEKRSTNITVTIMVLDLNDNDPVFTSTGAVHVSVLEGNYNLSSRFLIKVDATDADSGANGLLKYSIMSTQPAVPSGFFTINANTGNVSLSGRVTYPSDYVVVVKASDSAVSPDAIRSATKNLYVNITSAGNNAPQIPSTLYTITVSEGTLSGTSIFTVPAIDPDGQVLSFAIIGENAAGKFSINSSGQLGTAGNLDRETIPTYSLTVTVRDTTKPLPLSATTTVSVILTDVNDNNPVFPSQYQFAVQEKQPSGTSIGTVTATDVDQPNTANSKLTYRLNLANNVFAINQTTGQITTLQPLDYESQNQYILKVLAVDHANDSRTGTVSVTVNVTDVQDSVPLFIPQIFTANVTEGNANAFVIFVSAVDADTVDNIQYKFQSSATATTFTINSTSGQINTAVALDYENQTYYEFFVTTVDGQRSTNPSSTATVRVTVLDQNDNSPVFSPLSAASIQVFEDAKVNNVLVTISATDADATAPYNTLTYKMTGETDAIDFFDVDSAGRISVKKSLLNSGKNRYIAIISVLDGGSPPRSSVTQRNVTIIRNNFAPVITNRVLNATLQLHFSVGTQVYTVTAQDEDSVIPFGNILYSIIGDKCSKEYFAINTLTGIITLNRSVVNQNGTIYNIIVQAQDGGIPPRTDVAVIKVDVKDDQVFFTQTVYISTVHEGIATAFIVNVKKNPNIVTSDVTYRFLLNETSSLFSINNTSGVITTAIALDYETRKFYEFMILATYVNNSRVQSATAAVLVTVQDVNDNSPILTLSTNTLNVARDAGINILLTAATATDKDAPGTANSEIEYAIATVIPNSGLPLFSINRVMGHLVNVQSFTKEPKSYQYQITIRASDKGKPVQSSTTLFLLNITETASASAKTSDKINIFLVWNIFVYFIF
ncbi:hypothetical protein CHS0354_039203 [Potamilus streckersoni]|uniref:Cadherin domain-containing protein n=1 Tax=Potamilus streckersoni TaxID=2493646 RepID=A0AAE0WBK5_9BIVA|nr:hypothetical protein CHS0354_039203 [Potamilus streckersoni]